MQSSRNGDCCCLQIAKAGWHGSIHVVAYFTFFLCLLLAYVALAWGSWNRLDRASWRYAPLALLPWLGVFLLPDGLKASNYMFFAILLSPLLILAIRVLATGGWLACRAARRPQSHLKSRAARRGWDRRVDPLFAEWIAELREPGLVAC